MSTLSFLENIGQLFINII